MMTTRNTLASAPTLGAANSQSAAKARSQAEILIKAPLETIWALVVGIDRWPEWNDAVETASLEGPFERGAVFRWKSGGLRIQSTIQEIRVLRRLVWTGKTIGTSAVHSWTFEDADNGVLVTTTETFDGWLPTIMPRTMQRKLDETLPALLMSLKAVAERA
jgi:hypothetical protein